MECEQQHVQLCPTAKKQKVATPPRILNGMLGKRRRLANEQNAAAFIPAAHAITSTPNTTTVAHLTSAHQDTMQNATHAPQQESVPAANKEKNDTPANNKKEPSLKLKCLCKLEQQQQTNTEVEQQELVDFFARMFESTTRLSRAQQRLIKTELLAAICQAEASAEVGRNCAKCC